MFTMYRHERRRSGSGRSLRPRAAASAAVCAAVVAGTLCGLAYADPGVVPLNARVQGRTYGDYAAAWWNWAIQEPEETCPLTDPTGEDAALNQRGSVFFLAGTFGGAATRTVTIPAGKRIFFPIINGVWYVPDNGGLTEGEIRNRANFVMGFITHLEADFDGV